MIRARAPFSRRRQSFADASQAPDLWKAATTETNAMRMLSPPTYRATGAHRGQGLLVTKTG